MIKVYCVTKYIVQKNHKQKQQRTFMKNKWNVVSALQPKRKRPVVVCWAKNDSGYLCSRKEHNVYAIKTVVVSVLGPRIWEKWKGKTEWVPENYYIFFFFFSVLPPRLN